MCFSAGIRERCLVIVLTALLSVWTVASAVAGPGAKVGIYGQHLSPSGSDAKTFSEPGWGGGGHAVVPIKQIRNYFSGVVGFDYTDLLSERKTFRDRTTGLRVEQRTDQSYSRIYLGARLGSHGNAFVRPFAGANVALAIYNIHTDVVIPDDDDEDEVKQELSSETRTAFGYDFSFGLDLNFSNTVAVEGGVRYIRSLSVVHQLGEGSESISPEYYQIYLGVGMFINKFIHSNSGQ
jgi:opacity protein-like surface antigen